MHMYSYQVSILQIPYLQVSRRNLRKRVFFRPLSSTVRWGRWTGFFIDMCIVPAANTDTYLKIDHIVIRQSECQKSNAQCKKEAKKIYILKKEL